MLDKAIPAKCQFNLGLHARRLQMDQLPGTALIGPNADIEVRALQRISRQLRDDLDPSAHRPQTPIMARFDAGRFDGQIFELAGPDLLQKAFTAIMCTR